MNLKELCAAAHLSCTTEEIEISGVVSDSAKAYPGCLFVAIRGMRADGHEHAGEAIARGAVAVLGEEGVPPTVAGALWLTTDNTRRALSYLLDAWYGHPSQKLHLIAVTGTNGKTSVTFMLKQMFEAAMYKCGLIGTIRCYCGDRVLGIRSDDPRANMTTPDPEELYRMLAVMADEGVEYVFMEVTSHALALFKPDPLRFEAAVFTNLTPEHLDFHGTMEAYFEAKRRLFSLCDRAVINVDDRYGRVLAADCSCPVIRCSLSDETCECYAGRMALRGVDGIEYTLHSPNNVFRVICRIPGAFTVYNTLLAIGTALSFGIPAGILQSALASLDGIDGRIERVRLGVVSDFSVFVDYAHTPDALENLLRTARGFCRSGQRIVLVFGCGGDRDRGKRKEMGILASRMADFVIVTSDNSRGEEPIAIINDILSGMDKEKEYVVIPSRRSAIEYAIREARAGDVILLAGKGHETYEITKAGKHCFDEKKIAAEAARKYHAPRGTTEE